ncbi:hypothetical protein ADIS_0863 [Lunatimonas lonarensis]|uniref:Uncharacterized protein n=1 Tax=Lunatimonas lonarensis TaxID=1232681 RepID=R7ZXI2_9BACT|nr:hypothetical protein ADIS_0863 [Lunatimonas lonarensis]
MGEEKFRSTDSRNEGSTGRALALLQQSNVNQATNSIMVKRSRASK